MNKQIVMAPIVAVALLLSCCQSMVSAATVVTEYQWNPNGDWFADPFIPPLPGNAGFSTTNLIPETTLGNVSNMFNYATSAPINDALFAPSGPSGFSGPGLNLMVQNRNEALNGSGTGAGTLALRGNNGRLSFRTNGANGGGGSSILGWSSAANTSLNGADFGLFIGPASNSGEGTPSWEEGMRLAIQDTSDNWYLSNWASNGKVPVGGSAPASGTEPGLHLISLGDETWAPFTPATLSSTGLVEFNAGSATFSPFAGEAKAFGFYLQDVVQEGDGGTTAIRLRLNGFQVTLVPEPSSALLLGITGLVGVGLRRRRS